MNATELMIGNWVKLQNQKSWGEFKGRWFIVEAIGQNMGELYVQIKLVGKPTLIEQITGSLSQFMEYIQPIPLTPEILVKCGFVNVGLYSNDNELMRDCYTMPYKRQSEEVARQTILVVPYETIGYAFGVENIENDFRVAVAEITHLHQLQNLYLSLTGSPLNIEL